MDIAPRTPQQGMMTDAPDLRLLLRHGLEQLGARNAHHQFEELCLIVAQRRISPNFIPSTGPVTSGGDGGADFIQRASASPDGRPWIGACSIQKADRVVSKIAEDVKSAAQRTDRPSRVLFFSNQEIPTAHQERAREAALKDHDIALDIYDRHALIGWLTHADLHDLGRQFLNVPASLFHPEPYHRLKSLAEQHLQTAGRLPSSQPFENKRSLDKLYVERELETQVLEGLSQPKEWFFGVIQGEPGYGKTSLLWSLTHKLASNYESLFLQAATLQADQNGLARVGLLGGTGEIPHLIAFAAATRQKRPLLLLDTIDLLLHTDADRAILQGLIAAAQQAGCSMLVTCRPDEVESLNQYRPTRYQIRAYTEEEFRDAIQRHSAIYCPKLIRDEEEARIRRLLDSVHRWEPIRAVVLSPLMLRMLFEIYAPEDILHEEINSYILFERYWQFRVEDDRRTAEHGHRQGKNLRELVENIALSMLEEGTIILNSSAITREMSRSGMAAHDVESLATRGILVRIGEDHLTFFHQSFFEFAAAKGLHRQLGTQALTELQLLQDTIPDDLFRLPVAEQLLVMLSADGPAQRDIAGQELARWLASTSLPLQQGAVYVFVHWQQGEPEHVTLRMIADAPVLVMRRFYEIAGNLRLHRSPLLLRVLEEIWSVPNRNDVDADRQIWTKKENSFGLLERLAMRIPLDLKEFFDRTSLLSESVAQIGGAFDVAQLLRALLALAHLNPDWAFDRLLWLYEEALKRYTKRDTQRKILMLLAENPACFPNGFRLASKIEAQTTRRFHITVDGEQLIESYGKLWFREWNEEKTPATAIIETLVEDHETPKDFALSARFGAIAFWLPAQEPSTVDALWERLLAAPSTHVADRVCVALLKSINHSPVSSAPALVRLRHHIRELLGEWQNAAHQDIVMKCCRAIKEVPMHANDLLELLGAPVLNDAEVWLGTSPLSFFLPKAIGIGHPGAMAAMTTVPIDEIPIKRRQSLGKNFHHSLPLPPSAINMALAIQLSCRDAKGMVAILRGAQTWEATPALSERVQVLTKELWCGAQPHDRVAGYGLGAELIRLGQMPELPAETILSAVNKELQLHELQYVLRLNKVIGPLRPEEFRELARSLAGRHSWSPESLCDDAGRFIVDAVQKATPMTTTNVRTALKLIKTIQPSGRVLARFCHPIIDAKQEKPDEQDTLMREFLDSTVVNNLPRDGFIGFINIAEPPLIRHFRAATKQQLLGWIQQARLGGRTQKLIIRSLLRAAPTLTTQETMTWRLDTLQPDIQAALTEFGSERESDKTPGMTLPQNEAVL